ncbi:hypothetical protein CMI47_01160 [Candidatus Pacearchaeota archaeon]|nr:hypothetical protein [Candidatus Pacearchaeota archaeon]
MPFDLDEHLRRESEHWEERQLLLPYGPEAVLERVEEEAKKLGRSHGQARSVRNPLGVIAQAQEGPYASPELTQRWTRQKKDVYRKRGEGFDPSIYSVERIGDKEAKEFILGLHYLASYPAAQLNVGMFGLGGELVGVATFSVPQHKRVIPKRAGVPADEGSELGRFILLDDVPYLGETWFLANAMVLAKQTRPEWRAIVSFSDPVARRSTDRVLITPGHIGTIYQAFNMRFVGRSAPRKMLLTEAGFETLVPRSVSKIKTKEDGWHRNMVRLSQATGFAPPRNKSEASLRRWVEMVESTLRPMAHPGNIAYAYALRLPLETKGKRARRERRRIIEGVEEGFPQRRPFPKGLYQVFRRQGGFVVDVREASIRPPSRDYPSFSYLSLTEGEVELDRATVFRAQREARMAAEEYLGLLAGMKKQ